MVSSRRQPCPPSARPQCTSPPVLSSLRPRPDRVSLFGVVVDAVPKVVKEDLKEEEAEELKVKLEAAGATVELE